jgi:hypothetical protein
MLVDTVRPFEAQGVYSRALAILRELAKDHPTLT